MAGPSFHNRTLEGSVQAWLERGLSSELIADSCIQKINPTPPLTRLLRQLNRSLGLPGFERNLK